MCLLRNSPFVNETYSSWMICICSFNFVWKKKNQHLANDIDQSFNLFVLLANRLILIFVLFGKYSGLIDFVFDAVLFETCLCFYFGFDASEILLWIIQLDVEYNMRFNYLCLLSHVEKKWLTMIDQLVEFLFLYGKKIIVNRMWQMKTVSILLNDMFCENVLQF